MVNTGRPSAACQICRNRRIKCDGLRPSCSQCIRSKRGCRGYRDELALMFRDETNTTKLRASRIAATRRGLVFGEPFSQGVHYELSLEPEQLALQYFFTQFIFVRRPAQSPGSFLEGLPSLYASAESFSALSLATGAISFAVISRNPTWKHLLQKARSAYSKAMIRLKTALQDSDGAQKDETLMAILLLGLVEILTSTPTSPPQWDAHTDGAIALAKLRGRGMLTTETSLKLLLAVRTRMVTSHIQRSKSTANLLHVPENKTKPPLLQDDLPLPQESNATNRLSHLSARVPALRALADHLLHQPRNNSTIPLVLDLITRSRAIDAAFSEWCRNIPESWRYTSIAKSPRSSISFDNDFQDVWTENTDIYCDVWVAKAWNLCRTSQLFVQAIRLGCISWLVRKPSLRTIPSAIILEYNEAAKLSRQIVNKICRSVSFHLGHVPKATATNLLPNLRSSAPDMSNSWKSTAKLWASFTKDLSANQLDKDMEAGAATALGGYFILWPLFVARSIHTTPENQKHWIDRQIISIANSLGLDQAMILGKLKEGFQWSLLETVPNLENEGAVQEDIV